VRGVHPAEVDVIKNRNRRRKRILVAAYAFGNPDGEQDITVKGLSVARPNGGRSAGARPIERAPIRRQSYVCGVACLHGQAMHVHDSIGGILIVLASLLAHVTRRVCVLGQTNQLVR
jgi:hypothetical protein